jgi:hypothetical protein
MFTYFNRKAFQLQTWKQCQKILGQHGDKSFLGQMGKFDPKDANLELAVEAKKSIEPYTAEQIHTESSGAASIFIWVSFLLSYPFTKVCLFFSIYYFDVEEDNCYT